MPPTIEMVEADALQLTPAERADLIEWLITSLNADPRVEAVWAEEVERRYAEIQERRSHPAARTGDACRA